MYILDIDYMKKQCKKFFILSIVSLIFGLIYEKFSHEVYSIYMIGAFAIPLVFGVLVQLIIINKKLPTRFENSLYSAGIITFLCGSFIKGFLDIYGTTNSKIWIYLVIGAIFFAISFLSYLIRK